MRTTPAPSRHDMKLHGILDGISGDWQPTNVVVASCRAIGPPKCFACPVRTDTVDTCFVLPQVDMTRAIRFLLLFYKTLMIHSNY